jgi:pyrimidine deaminase RibD-like protein
MAARHPTPLWMVVLVVALACPPASHAHPSSALRSGGNTPARVAGSRPLAAVTFVGGRHLPSWATTNSAGTAPKAVGLRRGVQPPATTMAPSASLFHVIALFSGLILAALFALRRVRTSSPGALAALACSSCTCGTKKDDDNDRQSMLDKKFMAMALAEGEKGRQTAPPNPWVGCVIVKDGAVLGKGYHAKAGQPHAEPTAIADALAKGFTNDDLAGSTFYVTLEPCCHFGRTPPCTDALLRVKAARVVVAVQDPDERVAGNGLRILRDSRVEVVVGVLEAEANESLGPYLAARRDNRPFEPSSPPAALSVADSSPSV